MNIGYIKTWLKEHLSENRYFHALGTAQQALQLAQMFHLDGQKAYLAGLLHDCAKCMDVGELTKIIQKHIPEVSICELKNYKTLHAPVSAYLARTKFKIEDPEILSAISCHTLGKVDMTEFESIIFLADKIEINMRDLKFNEEILRILKVGIASGDRRKGLDEALLVCFKLTINSLTERNLAICTTTIDVYNSLLERVHIA